jgi:cell division protein FtsI (penicillin-binding protein 3)
MVRRPAVLRRSRTGIIHLALIAFAIALVVRAAYVGLWEGRAWAEHAAREHETAVAPAPARGAILDAAGRPLAISRSLVHIAVAPGEIHDRAALSRALSRAGVDANWVRLASDPHRRWIDLPARVLPGDAASVAAIRGVYLTPVAERIAMGPDGLTAITGHVGPGGSGIDGLEAGLDSLLRGDPGHGVLLHDALGRPLESPSAPAAGGRPGDAVVLTINGALQEICERALADAVLRMGASGGDVVVLDPHDGSILALASRRRAVGGMAATTLTEPYEPGSTMKPFIAASLLGHDRVAPTDEVDTHLGQITINGRTLTDEHRQASMTLRDVVRLSSNVGIAQFSQRLSPREEYEALRDAGFGSPTGMPLPGEAAGSLPDPAHWSKQTPVSLAIGYEVAVTPLQMALAYAAIANGGELLEPGLVREVRDPDGTVVYQRQRRVVRRFMTEDIARQLREMLVATVATGTASEADLPSYIVAGKTGTARRTAYGAGYERNEYNASFVGLFPGRDPQYVILVKIDDPTGSYFGGKTAAPLFKVILESALAARDASLDRTVLAADRRETSVLPNVGTSLSVAPAVPLGDTASVFDTTNVGEATVVPIDRPQSPTAPAPAATVIVPDLRGWTLRAAVRALHRAGLEVQLTGGPRGTTDPAPGTAVRTGSLVHLGAGA